MNGCLNLFLLLLLYYYYFFFSLNFISMMDNLLTCSFTILSILSVLQFLSYLITFGALTSLSAQLRLDFLAAGNCLRNGLDFQ